jgi:hypothetical protein
MLSSSWKAERESVFQRFRIFPSVSLSLPWLLVKQPFEARSKWHHHLCAPVRKKAPVVVFFSAEEKRATTEQNFRFEAFPWDLLLYSFFRGFGKSENPTSRGIFKLF